MSFLHRRAQTENGQDLLEYALLASLIALLAVGAVTLLGQTIDQFYWQSIGAAI